MRHRHPAAVEIDRIEAPGEQRSLGIGEARLRLFQPCQDGIEACHARPPVPVRIPAVLEADIGIVPDAAFHGMGMPLHEAGGENMAGEIVIQLIGPPFGHLVEAAGGEDTAVADGDMCRAWP